MMYCIYFVCGLIIGLSLYYLYLVVKDKKANMVTPILDTEESIVKVGHVAPTVEILSRFIPPPSPPTIRVIKGDKLFTTTPCKSTNKPPRDVDPLPLRTVSDRYDGDCKYESSSCSSTDSSSSGSSGSESSSSYSSSSSK